jgi:hypothetical protein
LISTSKIHLAEVLGPLKTKTGLFKRQKTPQETVFFLRVPLGEKLLPRALAEFVFPYQGSLLRKCETVGPALYSPQTATRFYVVKSAKARLREKEVRWTEIPHAKRRRVV